MIAPLTDRERSTALVDLPLWTFDDARSALHRRLVFADFSEALAAIVRIGLAAEQADHHPEWTNVYNRLDVWLTTHDAGGVSKRDLDMACKIDRICPAPQR